jgi:hypothetical protein
MISQFTYLPTDVCADLDLPDFPLIQDCVSYSQLRSEVCGLIIRPIDAPYPIAWYNLSEWYDESKIDNADPAAAHFIAGRGSFLPTDKTTVVLAGGRVEENREQTQRLAFNVLNMDAGHIEFGRKLQANKKDFTFYVTIGGAYGAFTENRIIGGYAGMIPSFVGAAFPFNEGANSRELMQITIDTEFLDFPAMPLPS